MTSLFDPPSPPKIPPPPAPVPIADTLDPAVIRARQLAVNAAAARSGRVSTELSTDKLGVA